MGEELNEEHSAAHSLVGYTLKSGWKVTEKMVAKPGSTGSHFSVCYLVEKEGEVGFLKVLNILKFLQGENGGDFTKAMAEVLETFNFEKELLERCSSKNLSKVSKLIDAGNENVKGFLISNIYYLLFEKADGDVRSVINFAENIDTAWKLRSLHNISVGLKQLHTIDISHQDLKPSNVFVFEKQISKLGDLGRSLCKNFNGPHSAANFSGDYRYCPPEIILGYILPDWHNRVFSIDTFLLGSMATFYFTGLSMTALLQQNLSRTIDWDSYRGRFKEAVPYLVEAFERSLLSIENHLGSYKDKEELINQIRMLCYPDPDLRGNGKNIVGIGNNYDLERFITKFNVLATRAEYNIYR